MSVLKEYQNSLRDDEVRRAIAALVADAQRIRDQVHDPLVQAIKSGEIRDGQAPVPHWDWKIREFSAETSIEQAADFVAGSEATKSQMIGYSDRWQSDTDTEFDRLKPQYREFHPTAQKSNCVDPSQFKKDFEELTMLISSAGQSQGDTNAEVKVFRSLHSQMLATELSETLACYQPKHP